MNILYFPQEEFENHLNKTYYSLFKKEDQFMEFIDLFHMPSSIDLILLPGGGDFSPSFSLKEDKTIHYNLHQDLLELSLIDYAKEHFIPILGICRGFQALLLAFDTPLEMDIKGHMNTFHKAILENKKEVLINSFHHQGVFKAPSFSIFLKSNDGVIEGIRHPIYPFIGVEFHPEKMNQTSLINFYEFLPVISR